MSFAYPVMALLPLLVGALIIMRRKGHAVVLFPSLAAVEALPHSWRAQLRKPVLAILLSLSLLVLAAALSRPQKRTFVEEPELSRNIMLALDVSKSMATEDFKTSRFGDIDRLSGVKEVVARFIQSRVQDRVGVVVFGSRAFLQAPLTRDHSLLLDLVDKLDVGIAGDGTEMGDGLALALKRMTEIDKGAKTVILLTDGVNSSGPAKPLEAARIAAQLGVKVHTIGIGSTRVITQRGFIIGGTQRAEFDEASLKKIADSTGGVYFHAGDTEGLEKVYQQIDQLETTEADDPAHEVVEELYPPLLVGLLILLLLALLLNQTIFMKVP